ncbi:MAG: hypothetical protein HYR85_19500 [Planctomycetes bacterium]|nr:hypothetical protein [Planctomycetota bacterium]MBI3846759.1 hypothetical protein [Planctomycetota bacterium]
MAASGTGAWGELSSLLRLLYPTARDIRKNALVAIALGIAFPLSRLARDGVVAAGIADPWATVASALVVGWIFWSFVSATLTRLAAFEVGAAEEPRLSTALRFALSRFHVNLLTAPSMLVAVALFLAPAAAVGALARVPVAGPVAAAILFPLALVSGFAAAATLVAFVVGAPLVSAALAVEEATPFDAVSRAFSYLVNAPATFVGMRLVMLAFGAVTFAIRGVMALAAAWGACRIYCYASGATIPDPFWPRVTEGALIVPAPSGSPILGFTIAAFYAYFVAFAFSWACTARVAVYLWLRRRIDGTHPCVIVTGQAPRRLAVPVTSGT